MADGYPGPASRRSVAKAITLPELRAITLPELAPITLAEPSAIS
jgi:hypothetical protein